MIVKQFTCKTLDECIREACDELNILEDELKYRLIENKSGLFIKRATIEVQVDEKEEKQIEKNKKDGIVTVKNGKIVVTDPEPGGKIPCITPPQNLKILVDGKEIGGLTEVSANSTIEVMPQDQIPQRLLNIEIDKNKMEAYITLKYVSRYVYKLKDCKALNTLKLEDEILEEIHPPIYKEEEIINALKNKNITYGLIDENIAKCMEKDGVENLLIAKGNPFIPDEDDVLEIKFKNQNNFKNISDDVERVDFKSFYSINEVKKGDIIAIKHIGKEGRDGVNICGKEVKGPAKKKINLKVGQGCFIKEDKVLAAIEGKPVYKNDTFCVYPIHEVNNDVDIASGNIDFIGEVIIRGSVKEGMEVKAQGDIIINKNVTQAKILSKSDIIIGKNIISSKIIGGGEDVKVLGEMDCLNKIKDELDELIAASKQIKKLTAGSKRDGEIVKLLIENKFKAIPKLYFKLLKCKCHNNGENNELLNVIKDKLMGFGPIKIKNINEIGNIVEIIDERMENLKTKVSLPVDVTISYCQDSVVKSSGKIFLNGMGEYVSEIIANDEVCFTNERAVARGGLIRAKNKIQCGKVGSDGGVITKLEVGKEGHIFAKSAYQNTIFIVGNREYVLDSYSKDVHVSLDSNGDLNVEKLNG